MKFDHELNNVIRRLGLRPGTGLIAAVCLAGILCLLTGCGTESELLSELRQEDAAAGSRPEEMEEDGPDVAQRKEQEADNGTGISAGPENGGEDMPDAAQGISAGTNQGADGRSIFVHVCGAVADPGVYEMPEGSRFYEAVEAAGGFAEDACRDHLNMAALLADGSRLEIPTQTEIREKEAAEGKDGGAGGDGGAKEYSYYTVSDETSSEAENAGISEEGLVNINTADIEGLCSLPGIGESRAKAIIEYREKQGGFRKKEDIMQVSGIGEKMYARMEALLTVE